MDFETVMKKLLDIAAPTAVPEENFDDFHHMRRFSLVKNHDPRFIAPLCKIHHHFVHSGLVANEEADPREWRVREQVDKNSPKYWIDKKVQERRMAVMTAGP